MVEDLSIGTKASESNRVKSAAKILGTLVQGEGVEDFADTIAESFGLKQKSEAVQTGAYILTNGMIKETAQLLGLGGGLALNMAQLKAKVEEINRKLDILLEAPLSQAIEFLEMVLVHLEQGNFAKAINELEKVKDHAMTAFQYAKAKPSNALQWRSFGARLWQSN